MSTFDPTFLGVSPVIPSCPSIPFDLSGEVSLVVDGEVLKEGATLASSTFATVSTISRGVTPEIPFIFPDFPHVEPLGTDFSGDRVSIAHLSYRSTFCWGSFCKRSSGLT